MTKEQQNIDDVKFICDEVERFASMTVEETRDHLRRNPGDGFNHLRHPTRGILFCGRSAFDRFGKLADRMITPASLENPILKVNREHQLMFRQRKFATGRRTLPLIMFRIFGNTTLTIIG